MGKWIFIAGGSVLAFCLWTASVYSFGVRIERTRNVASQVPELTKALSDVVSAKNEARAAYNAQIESAEKYAKDLKESLGKVTIITKEVPKYVAANPSSRSCDLDDFLWNSVQKAVDASNGETVRSR